MALFQYVAVLATVLLVGCSGRNAAECAVDTNCDLGGGGVCTLAPTGNQWCTYPDDACDGGYRYTENAGDDLGGDCVEGHTLTVTVGGSGSGKVSIDNGFTCSDGSCKRNFPEGTSVSLSAVATAGTFLGWSDECRGNAECVVTMDGDRTIGALFGTPGSSLWAKTLGDVGLDGGRSIVLDGDGNLIVIGDFQGTITPAPGAALVSSGDDDVYVIKYTQQGDVIWAKRFGEAGRDSVKEVSVDSLNNIYITMSRIAADFSSAAVIYRLNESGDIDWTRAIPGLGPAAIAANDTSVVVVGNYTMVTIDTTTYVGKGLSDILVINMSAQDGTTTWVKTYGGTESDIPTNVKLDNSQNVVVSCSFSSDIDFGRGLLRSQNGSVCLLKLSAADGSTLMSKQLGRGGTNNQARRIAVDRDNNIFVVGTFFGTAEYGCPTPLISQSNLTSAFLAKYTQAGTCLWAQAFGGPGASDPLGGNIGRSGSSVAVNNRGDVVITGSFCASISFGGQTFMSTNNCPSIDAFAARFDGDGVHLNSVRSGGTGYESAAGIAQSSDGRFFVTGSYNNFAEFGGSAFDSQGSSDTFIWALEAL